MAKKKTKTTTIKCKEKKNKTNSHFLSLPFSLSFSAGQGAWQPHGNLSTFSIPIPPRNAWKFSAEACGEGALRGHSGAEHLLCGPEECTDPFESASAVDTGGWTP